MIVTMLLGAAAGYATPIAEPRVKEISAKIDMVDKIVGEGGYTIFTLLVLLFLAAVVCAIIGASTSAVWLTLFVVVGMYGQKAYQVFKDGKQDVEDAIVVEDDE